MMHTSKLLGNPLSGIAATQQVVKLGLVGAIMPGGSIQEVDISESPFPVGRRADNRLYLHDPTVSGKHAQFTAVEGQVFLEDLGSTNW